MTAKVRSNIFIDYNLKEEAKKIFKKHGLSFSDGINHLLKQLKDKKTFVFNDLDIEPIYPDDLDYKLMQEARKGKSYSLSEVVKEFE